MLYQQFLFYKIGIIHYYTRVGIERFDRRLDLIGRVTKKILYSVFGRGRHCLKILLGN